MAFTYSSNVITQTGIDNDLTGLNGKTGVTTTTDNGVVFYQIDESTRLVIQGTLFHDPRTEVLILRHDHPAGNVNNPAMHIDAGGVMSPVQSWTRDNDNRLVGTTSTSHGLVVDQAVLVSLPSSNSDHVLHNQCLPIISVTNNTFTLGNTEHTTGTFTPDGTDFRVCPHYYYGVETTAHGRTGVSSDCGLYIVGSSPTEYKEGEAGIRVNSMRGLFTCKGGVITTHRPLALGGSLNIKDATLIGTRRLDTRSFGSGVFQNVNLVNIEPAKLLGAKMVEPSVNLLDAGLIEVYTQFWSETVLRDFDTTNNVNDYDIGHTSNYDYPHRDYILINPVQGSNIRALFRQTTNQNGEAQRGVTITKKEVHFNFKDSADNNIQDVKLYMADNPDPTYSKSATLTAPTLTSHIYTYGSYFSQNVQSTLVQLVYSDNADVTLTGDGTKDIDTLVSDYNGSNTAQISVRAGGTVVPTSGELITLSDGAVPTNTLGVFNSSDSSITYDYTNPIVYEYTSDASGDIAKFAVTTSAQIREYVSTDPSASSQNGNGGPYDIDLNGSDQWVDSSSDRPNYNNAWDEATEFGGFYKVDRRSLTNTDADDFRFNYCSYNHLLASTTLALKGPGEINTNWVLFTDRSVTETNKATVQAYTSINTPQQFYDAAKLFLYDNFTGEQNTLVSRDGDTIDAGTLNVEVDANITGDAFSYNGTDTITIKSTKFLGNIITTGTTTKTNTAAGSDAQVIGTFGADTVLEYTLENIDGSTRYELYNATTSMLVATEKLNLGAGYHDYSSTYIANTRTIVATANLVVNDFVKFTADITDYDDTTNAETHTFSNGTYHIITAVDLNNFQVTVNGLIYQFARTANDLEFYRGGMINTGDNIRLRCTCTIGVEAMLPAELSAVATADGITFQVEQIPDLVYNENGVNGQTLYNSVEWDADFTSDVTGVDMSDADGQVDVRQIYAFFVYATTTADGIANWFKGIFAIDNSNYVVLTANADIKLQNTGNVATIISGGRMYRDDNGFILHAESGDKPLMIDSGSLVANVQPQVESALNLNTKIASIKSNTGLIPGLL